MDKPVIKTQKTYPPIPIRLYDWAAWVDGDEEGCRGLGTTEAEAIADLQEQLENE